MTRSILRRGLGVLKRHAHHVVGQLQQLRVTRVRDFGWSREGAQAFSNEHFLQLTTDDSDWGYQLRSRVLSVPKGCRGVLTLCGTLTRGAVCVGFLDETGNSWLANHTLNRRQVRECIVLDPKDSGTVSIVISNAQAGSSELNLEELELAWMPEKLVQELGNTEFSIKAEINRLLASARPVPLAGDTPSAESKLPGVAVYLRTDYWVKIKAGGSYGHTCYVARELARRGERLVCFMPNHYELLDDMSIEQIVMDVPFVSCNEIDVLRASRYYYDVLRDQIAALEPRYIYERSILGSYVGARLSQELGIPYILEYNGSEISMKRSFDDRGYELEEAYQLAEQLAFAQASTIVAISEVIAEGLRKQGVPADKILVNPNGCSPEDYQALAIEEKRAQRASLGWTDEHCVVGFIGTFGGWHGIDVLAEALPLLCARNPQLRFLLIGDGNLRHLVDEAIKKHNLADRVHMPGVVPQVPAGKLLASSDILVSPHSRHMVDSRFFGSPTKLFEYMALGGAIIASKLEQIGDVLTPALSAPELHDVSLDMAADKLAVLCKPGDTQDFVEAVLGLAQRPDLWPVLGRNARQALVENYTWERHVEKILVFATQQARSEDLT